MHKLGRTVSGTLAGMNALIVPVVSHAQSRAASTTGRTFKDIVDNSIVGIGNQVLYIIYALAFAFFLFGVFKYFFSTGADAAKKRDEGKRFMLWGLIGLVVLFGVWGIVRILLGVLTSWA